MLNTKFGRLAELEMEAWKQRVMQVSQLFIMFVVIWVFAYVVFRLVGLAVTDVPAAILGGAATIGATHCRSVSGQETKRYFNTAIF